MFKNYLIISLRNLKKTKGYSLINIAGLTIGIVSFLLILIYSGYEITYDDHHKNIDQIFAVTNKFPQGNSIVEFAVLPAPLSPKIKEEYVEIEKASRYYQSKVLLLKNGDKGFYEDNIYFADNDFLEIFDFPLKSGNSGSPLKEKYSVILSEYTARKYFGDNDPAGKNIVLDNKFNLTVTGVLEELPSNSFFHFDMLVPFSLLVEIQGEDWLTDWHNNKYNTFVKLNKGVSSKVFERKIRNFISNHSDKRSGSGSKSSIGLEPFKNIHFSDITGYYTERRTSKIYIFIFLSIGFLILLISCVNYINIMTAKSVNRSGEIGLRKVVGATKFSLFKQFIGESVLYNYIALIFALLIIAIILPSFSNLTEQDLKFTGLLNSDMIIILLIIPPVVGFLAGCYPALIISSLQPVTAIKSKLKFNLKGSGFKQGLIIFQLSVTVFLIICTLTINRQLSFIKSKNLGFNKDQVIILPIQGEELKLRMDTFKNELLGNPEIKSVSFSDQLPSNINKTRFLTWEGSSAGKDLSVSFNRIDHDFIDTYDLNIIEGRNFQKDFPSDYNHAVIVNKTLINSIGWHSSVGKTLSSTQGEDKYRIIGVIEDFHFRSLRNEIKPLMFLLNKTYIKYISIKISTSNFNSAVKTIGSVWKKINSDYPFNFLFFDEQFEKMYRFESKTGQIFRYFSFLAIIISCLGLFGLISFTAEQRSREIGLRKVLGASVNSIVILLSSNFLKLIVISNIIAIPVSFYIIRKWLNEFAYRTSVGFDVFVLAVILSFAVSIMTIFFRAVKAAYANPIDVIKYE